MAIIYSSLLAVLLKCHTSDHLRDNCELLTAVSQYKYFYCGRIVDVFIQLQTSVQEAIVASSDFKSTLYPVERSHTDFLLYNLGEYTINYSQFNLRKSRKMKLRPCLVSSIV